MQRMIMTMHISEFSRNGVKGGPDINRTASPGNVCHARQVTPDRHQATSRINYQKRICIATWNVRALFTNGKLENSKQEITRMNVNILDMAEVRWMGAGRFT